MTQRILVWFSCGAASAVAWKVAEMRYGQEAQVEACYCDLSSDEHPDSARFMSDVEKWVGKQATRLKHPKYKSIESVWCGERYIVGTLGASCSRVLKREMREKYQRPGDLHVFGFTADEKGRISDFEKHHPNVNCLWLLVNGGITKSDCYHILTSNGIEIPLMYRLGYNNNNCIGCCKGGKGYWNKIRKDFPEVFARRAGLQRELGVQFGGGDYRFFLDELDPNSGADVPEPDIECGVFCSHYQTLVDEASSVNGKK